MSEKWEDYQKRVQAKGPYTDPEPAREHGFDVPEDVLADGYYILLERDGRKRPIGQAYFEDNYTQTDE